MPRVKQKVKFEFILRYPRSFAGNVLHSRWSRDCSVVFVKCVIRWNMKQEEKDETMPFLRKKEPFKTTQDADLLAQFFSTSPSFTNLLLLIVFSKNSPFLTFNKLFIC